MFVQNLRRRIGSRLSGEGESGFTLVELLVVMLILGLLAAIAIPSFFNQRDKATDADAKAAARTAQTAMETFATDNGGSYSAATTAQALIDIEPSLGNADLEAPTGLGDKTYTVTVNSEVDGQSFSITRFSNGVLDSDCTVPGTGGCPTDGNWADEGTDPDA